MRSFHTLFLIIGVSVVAGYGLSGLSGQVALGAGGTSAQLSEGALPKDIYPDTGNRLPAIKREDLDETGKKLFDLQGPGGSFGPRGIRLYSIPVADYANSVNDYLRRKSGLDPRLAELAILVTTREMDAEFVWSANEPTALKAGLEKEIIDTVKYRRPVTNLGEKEVVIILLGRQVLGKHKVDSDVFARGLKQFGNQGLVNLV